MLNPREEKKQKNPPKKKTSETAIKSLEELSRVMRCRQSIPSFYPHVKSAPPPSSHNMCKQHFVYYERKHRNVLVQLHSVMSYFKTLEHIY